MKDLDALLDQNSIVSVWGNGYIGYSSMLNIAAKGVTCIGYDPDQARVELINKGRHPVPGLEDWLNIDPSPLIQSGRLHATTIVGDVLKNECLVHLVAVPTERGGSPWWEPLIQVVNDLAKFVSTNFNRPEHPPLVLIESTLAPGTTDSTILPILRARGVEVGKDLLLGIAPRRDWFISPDKNLRTLDRVYCGIDDRSAEATLQFLGILCDQLHRAPDYRTGEMVKCVENAYRHVDITLANQLSLAYPDVDIREVLRLAGTKWNMGSFQPSFGTGGYCIPLAGQYVLQGATHPEHLTIISDAFASDLEMRRLVARAVISYGCRVVGILGLSYRGNMKVSVMSPAILIAKHLARSGVQAEIHDPYFTSAEIIQATGLEAFHLLDDLDRFDCLLVNADHTEYLDVEVQAAVLSRADKLLVIDNYGIWSQWPWPAGAAYYRPGSNNWLAPRGATPSNPSDVAL